MNLFKKIWYSSPSMWFLKFKNVVLKIVFILKKEKWSIHKLSNGLKIWMPYPVPIEYKSMLSGDYENFITKFFIENNKGKDLVVWDIGAHIGYQSLVFVSILGEKSTVLCFEPNNENVKWLNKNIIVNNYFEKIKVFKMAISNKVGRTKFFFSDKNDATSSGGYVEDVVPPLPENIYHNFKKTDVNVETIDSLIFDNNLLVPNLIKIDVEGAEYKVLQGGLNTIIKYKPDFIIEIHSISMMFYVASLLEGNGYKISILEDYDNSLQTKIIYASPK